MDAEDLHQNCFILYINFHTASISRDISAELPVTQGIIAELPVTQGIIAELPVTQGIIAELPVTQGIYMELSLNENRKVYLPVCGYGPAAERCRPRLPCGYAALRAVPVAKHVEPWTEAAGFGK